MVYIFLIDFGLAGKYPSGPWKVEQDGAAR